jgi:molecular chaperone GrpE
LIPSYCCERDPFGGNEMSDVTTDAEAKKAETQVEVETTVDNADVLDMEGVRKSDASAEETGPVVEEVEDIDVTLKASELAALTEFKDKYYYLAAEFENTRKRFAREKDNLLKYGNEKVLSALLEVVDNLERTSTALVDDKDEKIINIVTGVNMVQAQFLEVLKNNGLEEVESVGKSFDPKFHEALAQQPSDEKADQEIIQEYQKGYILNGRLIRAAKVVVANNPDKK